MLRKRHLLGSCRSSSRMQGHRWRRVLWATGWPWWATRWWTAWHYASSMSESHWKQIIKHTMKATEFLDLLEVKLECWLGEWACRSLGHRAKRADDLLHKVAMLAPTLLGLTQDNSNSRNKYDLGLSVEYEIQTKCLPLLERAGKIHMLADTVIQCFNTHLSDTGFYKYFFGN